MIALSPRRLTAVLGAAGILATSLILGGSPGIAQASSTIQVNVCAQGNYKGYAEVAALGTATLLASPGGNCTSMSLGAGGNIVYGIEVIGVFNTSSNQFTIGSIELPGTESITIDLRGTTANGGKGASFVTS